MTLQKSRTQSLQTPLALLSILALLPLVHEAIVQSALPTLPKLNALGDKTQTAPEVRHGDLVLALEALLDFFDPAF